MERSPSQPTSPEAGGPTNRGDYETAFQEWQASARQGNADAQYLLGAMYRDGKGTPRDMLEFVF